MLDHISDGDWEEAFKYANGFTREDVAEVVAAQDGFNDGDSWIGVFKLVDGRFAWLTAWCDYTGWGCQEGGESAICDDIGDLILGHVGLENARRLSIPFVEA